MTKFRLVVVLIGLIFVGEVHASGWLNIQCVSAKPASSPQGPITSTSTFGVDIERSLARTGVGDLPIKVSAEKFVLDQTLSLGDKQQMRLYWEIHRKTGVKLDTTYIIEGGRSTVHERKEWNCKGVQ